MEAELRAARDDAVRRARDEAKRRARAAAARAQSQSQSQSQSESERERPSDEELGYISTDDSFSKILRDAASGLSERLDEVQQEARDSPVTKRFADLIDELGSKLTGEPPKPDQQAAAAARGRCGRTSRRGARPRAPAR